jgi:predicted site-specific integrase-resolvase
MKLKEWAIAQNIHPQTAYNWFRDGVLPVRAERVGPRTIIVFEDGPAPAGLLNVGGLGLYSRVSSHDQKTDLARQADRLQAWAVASGIPIVTAVSEVGSGMNGSVCGVGVLRRVVHGPEQGGGVRSDDGPAAASDRRHPNRARRPGASAPRMHLV